MKSYFLIPALLLTTVVYRMAQNIIMTWKKNEQLKKDIAVLKSKLGYTY